MNPGAASLSLRIIKHWEALRLEAYQCSARVWTIGYGHTQGVRRGDTCTLQQAEQYLNEDFAPVRILVGRLQGLASHQSAALGSLGFNTQAALTNSTLVRLIQSGQVIQASAQFDRWCKVRLGAVLVDSQGLKNRRAFERAIYEGNHPWVSK